MKAKLGLNLHHIGHAVADIDATAQLYTHRFGYEMVSAVIHDPSQTARVQFLRLPGDTAYLELVSPDGPGSKLVNSIKRGGGLNHLCYTCGPLESALTVLEESGMKVISDPKPGIAFAGRRICWLLGHDPVPIELVERREESDPCTPGI